MNNKVIMYALGALGIAIVISAIFTYFLAPTYTPEPKTQYLTVEVYHEDTWARPAGIEAGLPEHERIATQYVWKPHGMTVFVGDTVVLTIINGAGSRTHSFVLPEFNIDTGLMLPKEEKTVTFVADKVGTFEFACGIPFDPEPDADHDHINCSPGHKYQTGFFTVLDR